MTIAPPHRPSRGRPARQRGAVLIIAMVLLVMLTLLGVSAMNTTSLGEKMAANSQENMRAFNAAESGLNLAFDDGTSWDLSGAPLAIVDDFGDSDNAAEYTTTFLSWAPPPPGSMYSATSFQSAHFDFQSGGCTVDGIVDSDGDGTITDECADAGGLIVILHGGAYQIAPIP